MKPILHVLILFAFLGMTDVLDAQSHAYDTTRCTVRSCGNYRIELADCYHHLDIDVFDWKGNALQHTTITGSAEFIYLDETSLITDFKQLFKTHSLRAHIPAPGFYICKVRLVIEGETIQVSFDNECKHGG